MKLSKETIITLVILSLIVGSVSYYTYSTRQEANENASSAAVALNGKDEMPFTTLDDMPIDLRQFDGQVRVVNSWASWCPFCVNELPAFGQLASEFKNQDVVVIAINRKEDPRLVNAYMDRLTEVSDILFVLDAEDAFYRSIGGFSMPETIFYDAEGEVVVHKRGHMTLDEMRIHVEAAINAPN